LDRRRLEATATKFGIAASRLQALEAALKATGRLDGIGQALGLPPPPVKVLACRFMAYRAKSAQRDATRI
jgi:hypothetical protein